MALRSHLRLSIMLYRFFSIAVCILLFATSQRVFPQDLADPEEPEAGAHGESWSAEMEQRVWAALAQVDTPFISILSVECAYPSCQIVYDSTDSSHAKIRETERQLEQHIGKDHLGLPLIKQVSFGRHTVSPGYTALGITFSTKDPQFEASQWLEACRRARDANRPLPRGMTTCDP